MVTCYKPLNSVLVKPAGPDCNMACQYCFYLEKERLFQEAKVHRMSDTILEEMVKQVMEQSGTHVSFGWQGGEPTLMGLPFFEKAVELQQKYGHGQTVGNGLQTNGLLLDENWAQFLRKYNFLVGLSLDGPEHIHDHYRRLRGNQPTWATVVEKGRLLLSTGVAVNALTVVNDYSARFPGEIYDFHKEFGLTYMQFIPCVETDPENPHQAALFSVSPERYGEFLCEIFDRWYNDFANSQPTTSVRYFDSVFFRYVGLEPPECTLLPECGVYVVIEHNGDVYSCDFFVEPEWKLGNLLEGRIIDFLNQSRQSEFGRWKGKYSGECHDCQWLRFCYGGCTKDRIRDPRDQQQNHFCIAYKMFFSHAHSRLQRLAVEWQRQQEITASEKTFSQYMPGNYKNIKRNDPCPCGSGLKFKHCCGR